MWASLFACATGIPNEVAETAGPVDPGDTGAPEETEPADAGPPDRSSFVGCVSTATATRDGAFDSETVTTFNASGWVARVEATSSFTTFEADNPWGLSERTEIDLGPDGRVDYRFTATYDAAWLPVEQVIDADGDGVPDEVWAWTFADGRAVAAEVDEGGDGTVDVVWSFAYDALGRIVDEAGDRGSDGSIDERRVREWDVDGWTWVEEYVAYGDHVSTQRTLEDASGRLLTFETDTSASDLPYSVTQTWRYVDEDGPAATGAIVYAGETYGYEASLAWSYDDDGREVGYLAVYEYTSAIPGFTWRVDTTWACPTR